MALKVLLDANILLDATLRRKDAPTADRILELAVSGSVQAFVTPSILHICGYWLAKAYSPDKARQLLLLLLADVRSIDLPHEGAVAALHSSMKDLEDALQYYTAMHHHLDLIVSRDKGLVKEAVPGLPVISPEDLLKEF